MMIMVLAAVPTLNTAAPLDCRVRPLTDADHLTLDESFLEWQREELRKERVLSAGPSPSWMTASGAVHDGRARAVAPPVGVEIVEPPGCPEISDSHWARSCSGFGSCG
ncbi:hypothetical protein FHS43_006269 [Streptosporangium becharense]|uniref:Uncharacterized protein n=1 Tax=Streptosporangium becharense TaxID=1816182 RepID=A0A7W9IGB5_9ACTN|nr:hypothetical protein [Streptosporangium becharense]MBB2914957.1 hypothetical protein [Streptosporangium becharense]MBB5820232.1 hypothetical protein [Streptosporangium becharense]